MNPFMVYGITFYKCDTISLNKRNSRFPSLLSILTMEHENYSQLKPFKCQMSDESVMKICRFYGPGPQGRDLGAPRPMHHCVTG